VVEVASCVKCGRAVTTEEGYITDAEGNHYHEKCYAEAMSKGEVK